ncbi:MAG TPA: hypothetical protein EYM46_02155 [Acidimicrobiia bacterium]|nr:hypothetical protein [Acidimicrobiia bacterium]
MRPSGLLIVVSLAATGLTTCGGDAVTDPSTASTCAELVEAGRVVAEQVLDRLSDQTMAEVEAADPDNPFSAVDRLMRSEEFEARAFDLGCSGGELEAAACLAYQGLAHRARGDLARQYLAPYFTACG